MKKITDCQPVPQIDSTCSLTKVSDTTNVIYKFKNGSVSLPGKGVYKVHLLYEWAVLPKITVADTGLYVYEYRQPTTARFYSMHEAPRYGHCDKLLNGYYQDLYPNGNLKLRGTFINGRVKDSLVTFYNNGSKNRKEVHFTKETLVENFDSLGHRSEIGYYSNKYYYLSDYRKTQFYPNGDTKLEEKRKGQVTRIAEFYADNQLKTKQDLNTRTEYFANGKVQVVYRWKAKRDRDKTSEEKHYSLIIEKMTYNVDGDILAMISYESFKGKRQPYFDDSYDKDWIIKSVKYQNGKEVFRVEDIYPEEYTAKYPDQ